MYNIAKKIYHLLFRRGGGSPEEIAARAAYDELTKKRAPTTYGMREEYPELPQPFERKATTIEVADNTALAVLYTGQKIYVDTRDLSLAPHIMVDGVWEAHVTRAIATLLNEDDIFFDVGANFGYYSCVAATRLKKRLNNIVIHAFEPNPSVVPLLQKTFNVNGLETTARINAMGVSDKPGELTLHRGDTLWGSASFNKDLAKSDSKDTPVKVPVTTLDEYYKKQKLTHVDLIKIDVEGHEDHVYAGMQGVIKDNSQLKIVMEFTFGTYQNESAFFAQLLKDYAFMYYIDPRGEFEPIEDFKTLREKTDANLVMIVLTNKELS